MQMAKINLTDFSVFRGGKVQNGGRSVSKLANTAAKSGGKLVHAVVMRIGQYG